jgi:hypothetical protein
LHEVFPNKIVIDIMLLFHVSIDYIFFSNYLLIYDLNIIQLDFNRMSQVSSAGATNDDEIRDSSKSKDSEAET